MFGGVEASAWMHVRNGTFEMEELIGIQKAIWCELSLLTFSTGLEKVKSPTGLNHCK